MSVAKWSGLRVALVAIAWPVVVVAIFTWQLSRLIARSPEIGAVSASTRAAVLLLAGPPALLVAVWLILRRASR